MPRGSEHPLLAGRTLRVLLVTIGHFIIEVNVKIGENIPRTRIFPGEVERKSFCKRAFLFAPFTVAVGTFLFTVPFSLVRLDLYLTAEV